MSRGFGSDNHSGVHPKIMRALNDCNQDHAPSYGTDTWSEELQQEIKKHFGAKAQAFLVFNGTAANVLSVRSMVQSHQAILCADLSHLNVDECGAPEYFAGCKLIPIPSYQGKIRLEDIKKSFIRRGDQHYSQIKAVSITQPTEMGTCYSLQEIQEIADWCRSQKLYLHIDGARLANAVYHLKTSFAAMTTDLGVDVVSLGGTKNGLMMGEAVIFLNSALAEDFRYLRKQSAQLPSKTRFIAASFTAYLRNELWLKIAEHSCEMAEILYQKLQTIKGIQITAQRQSNAVFAKIPSELIKTLRKSYFFYVWNEETFECRLMTSWDTEKTEIENFSQLVKDLLSGQAGANPHGETDEARTRSLS